MKKTILSLFLIGIMLLVSIPAFAGENCCLKKQQCECGCGEVECCKDGQCACQGQCCTDGKCNCKNNCGCLKK